LRRYGGSVPSLHAREGGVLDAMGQTSCLLAGTVRAVPIGELNRHTSKIAGSVAAGERLVVTRHADPVAVVLSVRDVVEVLAESELPILAESARSDYGEGRVVEAWEHAGPFRIVLAQAAAEGFRRLPGRDRGGLRTALCRGDADASRPLWLPTGCWLAPFSYAGDRDVVVHAFIATRPLERAVVGEDIWQGRLRRNIDRLVHARSPWHRAAPGD
jgi:prevent-host-death family protein